MDNNYTFNEMMFLSYQPFLLREDGGGEFDNINRGEMRTEAILERDKEIVSRLGYVLTEDYDLPYGIKKYGEYIENICNKVDPREEILDEDYQR